MVFFLIARRWVRPQTHFYYKHSELSVKYNNCLKTVLQKGTSKPVIYGDLVNKYKRIVKKPFF